MTQEERDNLLISVANSVGRLEKDVSVLKEDVSVLKEDVSGLKEDVSGLKQSVGRLERKMDRMEDDILEIKGIQQIDSKQISELYKYVSKYEYDVIPYINKRLDMK